MAPNAHPEVPMAWLVYGATGYTGRLVVDEAVRRGHRPILAGRDPGKVRALAETHRLEHRAAPVERLAGILDGVEAVLNLAGPFSRTAVPAMEACLARGLPYADISGESSTFEAAFDRDRHALERNVALVPGVGFDVVATDCLARYVAERVPGAVRLEIAVASSGRPSAGTIRSMLEILPGGAKVRRGDAIRRRPLGRGLARLPFPGGARFALPLPLADLWTGARTTRIQDITTYAALSAPVALALWASWPISSLAVPALGGLLARPPLRTLVDRRLSRYAGPGEATRRASRTLAWARATDGRGRDSQAWLEAPDGYTFTARSAVLAMERLLAERPRGALTPALAFGADFVLGIEGTRRLDRLAAPGAGFRESVAAGGLR
jgi:short subunit dehydrogenase-like uncharacterized protein